MSAHISNGSVRERKVAEGESSLKLLEAFVAFAAGRELFLVFVHAKPWVADLVGLGLWVTLMYFEPPRPKPLKLLAVTAALAFIIIVLHHFNIG